MEQVRFSARLNAFEKGERIWIADPDGLQEVWPDGQVRMLPWHALSVVIAGHSPSRLKPERYSVRFVFRHNSSGDTIVVDNMHFEGIGRFSARSPEYAGFIRGALSFAHAARPDAKYRGGTGMVSYGAQAGLAAATLLLVAYAIMTFGLGGMVVWIKLALIAVLTVLVLRWAIRARPGRLNPLDIDTRFLPEG